MATYRIRPTKPAAVFSAVVGAGMIVVGVVQLHHMSSPWFLVPWVVAVVGIVGFNLWSAFSGRGGSRLIGQTITREDEPASQDSKAP